MLDKLTTKQVVHLGNLALSGTTAAASAYVDLQGFGACTIVMVNNTVTDAGTASGFTATLQECDDTTAAGAGTVATGDAIGGTNTITVTLDTADDVVAGAMGYRGDKRYVGVSVVGTTNTAADVSILAILEDAAVAPPTLIGTKVART